MPQAITVLVVEDEPLISLDVADQLEKLGFIDLEASNANEALDMLIANPAIQVMFTDVDMPGGMNGLKLAAAVHDQWPPVRIIVTSGHRKGAPVDMPNGSRFFTKPYRANAVAAAMREMVG